MRFFCFALLLVLLGCNGRNGQDAQAGAAIKPSDPEHLEQLFQKIVQKAQAKDEAGVLAAMEPYFLTREEMLGLYGSEKGERAWLGYNDTIAADLRKEAPRLLIDQVAQGLTEVTVEMVGPAYPDRTTPGDQRMLDDMLQKQAMYTVRLHKPEEKLGLRLNGFLFIGGQWRSLFKTYDYLPGGVRLETDEPEEDDEEPNEAGDAPAEAPAEVTDEKAE